jgi:hypothetical protein
MSDPGAIYGASAALIGRFHGNCPGAHMRPRSLLRRMGYRDNAWASSSGRARSENRAGRSSPRPGATHLADQGLGPNSHNSYYGTAVPRWDRSRRWRETTTIVHTCPWETARPSIASPPGALTAADLVVTPPGGEHVGDVIAGPELEPVKNRRERLAKRRDRIFDRNRHRRQHGSGNQPVAVHLL